MIVIISLVLVFVVFPATLMCRSLYRQWNYSEPTMRILREYKGVPKDYQREDIKAQLKVLDNMHGIPMVDNHFFTSNGYDRSREFSWNGNVYSMSCKHSSCDYHEYKDIYSAVLALKKAAWEQEEAFRIAGIDQDRVDQAKSLADRLHEDASITRQVTKEIS